MQFIDGIPQAKLKVIDTCNPSETGMTLLFWTKLKYFDTSKFTLPQLKHLLCAKAFLCPGRKLKFHNQ
jgi:topoisomerase-4 subunit B